ncbi:hypothetical protein SSX86_029598 [Deinandra increscens subsp. villosa]|uniref:Zinc finger MYM-type protein 1-like n=1 Tax=Deinandra increscens subsp. villosa TaxID=3103831 RepID=A0AAP0CCU4_9ASTR
MAIVLRFVDAKGVIRERFLDIVHVQDTVAATLKDSLWNRLSSLNFDTGKIRGQGYDGASNMSGEWNGLQALVRQDSPYAYYVHCFAHRLQLALVSVSREVDPVHEFFTNLSFVINVVCASSKRHDELQKAKADEIKELLELGEIKSGKGKNQVRTLKRAGDTRWGSHYNSICSLVDMFDVTRTVLKGIMEDTTRNTRVQRGDANIAYTYLKSFEFVFVLHMMKEMMQKTDALCQGLQKKSQDILNAMNLVKAAKVSLNDLRNEGWDSLIEKVISFCQRYDIEQPDMSAPYKSSRYRPRKKDLHFSFEHFYRVDLFMETLDKQIHDLDYRFNEQSIELLSLGSTLCSKVINVDHIVLLVEKYYPTDFTKQEINHLRGQLDSLQVERKIDVKLSKIGTLSDLCQTLVESGKNDMYDLVERVCRLLLTLPVSTATTERGFSAMKIFKTRLRSKMSDDNLANSMMIYIEKEIANMFDADSIIEEFKDLKGRRAEL